ncbi:MAG: thioredoxin domain-containing protein [Gemmatimonadetes bacterium]|nr:thioredoxin domain-containing protein [Gemmatimonadota bacterium]
MASRLASQQSAYLRSAAHQPVEWHPWSAEAFERAKRENKPILLDIGAVWCHWCHVMDGESYENPRVAEALNRDWICIKVDRDERPDVDARYQRAVQLFSGQGGWPLTGFLTPDGEVFYGGTYFPPDGMHGRPGFLTVLAELSRIYREDPARVSSQTEQIRRHLEGLAQEASPGPISDDLLHQAAEAIAHAFDFPNGGFGTQPKFPHPGACDFLLARWFDTRHPWLRDMVDRTLAAMATSRRWHMTTRSYCGFTCTRRPLRPLRPRRRSHRGRSCRRRANIIASLRESPTGSCPSWPSRAADMPPRRTRMWVSPTMATTSPGHRRKRAPR